MTKNMANNMLEEDLVYPETDEIESELARFLYEEHCAILVVENLPSGCEFGIDMIAYRVGEKFKGVKLIPPGIHFIYASAVEKNSFHCAPRSGFFYNFKKKELVIRRWSVTSEEFDLSYLPSKEQVQRYDSNKRDLDQFLGAYKFSNYKTYLSLTNELSHDFVIDFMPVCGQIRSVPYLTRNSCDQDAAKRKPRATLASTSRPTEESLLPDLKPDPTTVIRFTKIPNDHIESKQAISCDLITQYNLDTTMKLEQSFGGEIGRQRLLAEFQFAFITFLLCHHYDCFEHWKKLLNLVCLADTGISKFPTFYIKFTRILENQIDHIPEDLFDDIVDDNNLVRHLLDTFFQNVRDCPSVPSKLCKSIEALKKQIEDKFCWQFDLEHEDEQPVVVDL